MKRWYKITYPGGIRFVILDQVFCTILGLLRKCLMALNSRMENILIKFLTWGAVSVLCLSYTLILILQVSTYLMVCLRKTLISGSKLLLKRYLLKIILLILSFAVLCYITSKILLLKKGGKFICWDP